jgi:hypothetical protein
MESELFDVGANSINFDASSAATLDPALAAGLFAMMAVIWVVGIIVYIYMALCMYKIAKKMNAENPWFAWIPILNVVLMIQIAKKPLWWIVLMLIPFVNIVIAIVIMVEFLKVLGKPAWWVILMMIPVVNLVVWGMLAFGKK